MDSELSRYFLIILLASLAHGQMLQSISNSRASTPVSNIALVQSVACNNGSTNASYSCTITSTTAGDLLVVLEEDADNPAAPSTAPACNSGGCTFTQDGSFANGGAGRMTVYSSPNIPGSKTSVTITPTSGHSSVNVREYSGTVTSSPLDVIIGSLHTNSASAILVSDSVTSTVNDVAIGWCATGVTTNANYVQGDNWANAKDFPQPNDATDSIAGDIINAFPSQITYAISSADNHNYVCGAVTYKSAVAGTSTGAQPPSFIAFDGAASGTTQTLANLTASTHGSISLWTIGTSPATGMTLSSSCALHDPTTPVYVNGKKYSTNTQGMCYDLSQTNKQNGFAFSNGGSAKASVGYWFNMPNPSDAVNPYTWGGFTAGGTDFADLFVQNGAAGLEISGCDGSTISISYGTTYWVTILYDSTATHKLRLYDTSGVQVGSESSCAHHSGATATTSFAIGRTGGEPGNPSITVSQSGIKFDLSASPTYPLLP